MQSSNTNYYVPEKLDFGDCADFEIDQTVIVKAEYLSKISSVNYKKESGERFQSEVYPYVNSYYCHVEDADALSKVNSLLAQPDILKSTKEKEHGRPLAIADGYSEKEAQIKYLNSKPVSFIILGKPDIGQQELGKELSVYWNCVYIEPEALIKEEIVSGTSAGECIEFNLRSGRAIGIDIIIKLVSQKVKSELAKHRGFVFCGLPLIPNDLCEDDPVTSQSAMFIARDIFEEVLTVATNFYTDPDYPQLLVPSKYQSDAEELSAGNLNGEEGSASRFSDEKENSLQVHQTDAKVTISKDYKKQLDLLFNMLDLPYFIIYIQCGVIDVLNKHDSYRFDISSDQVIDVQKRPYYYNDTLLTGNDLFDPSMFVDADFRLKHLVQLPRDFKANVSSQLDQYHYAALNFIQARVLAHNPEYYIKVDGRTSIYKMMSILNARLNMMNVQQVIIPKKLGDNDLETYFQTDELLTEEDLDTPRQEEDEKNLTPQEYFTQLKKVQVPSRSYLWSWSEWGAKCPVSMKMGFIREGNIKYAVQFMNKIYFLSDQDAYFKFCQNPRLFLLPPYPRSTCRILIFGPKRSGRSALAHCLAYYLGGSVLSTDEIMDEFMQQQQDEYLEKLREEATIKAIALLNQSRSLEAEEQEKVRIENIKEWVKAVISLLEEMSNLLSEIQKEEKKEQFEISSFPMAMKKVQTADMLEDSELAESLSELRQKLQELNVPIYRLDVPTWKGYITERKKLLRYLPPELAQKYQPKPATALDDFVKEYVAIALANAGLNDIQLNGGSILELFVNYIKIAEHKYKTQGFERGGWIIDGMLCNLKVLQDFFPDYSGDDIIVLQDTSNFLISNFKNYKSTFFRDFRFFFETNGMQDAALRSPSVTSTENYKVGMAKNILNDILENERFYRQSDLFEDTDSTVDKKLEEYKKCLLDFESNWSNIRQFYLENNITPIEIDVSGKTLPELFKETLNRLDSKYMYVASRISEEDRAEELTNLGHRETDGSAEEDLTPTDLYQVRRYGDTSHFCPVTFAESSVLWKGKEDFAVKYNEKVYLLATESDMQKFLTDPRSYLPKEFVTKLPPPRICIVGVTGCGKTYLAKSLSKNYGLMYLSFEQILKSCFNIFTNETLNEISTTTNKTELRSYLNADMSLPDSVYLKLKMYWLQEPFTSTGFVFDDFPKTHHDIDFMINNKLIPDIILYPQADETYLKTKFLDRYLKSWQETLNKQRQENELKHSEALEKWREQRSIRFDTLIEERREKRYARNLDHSPTESSTSLVSFDSVADQKDIDEVNKILDTNLPPIVYDVPVENSKAFISETEPLIFNLVKSNTATLRRMKEKCLREQINFVEIPLNLDRMEKTKIAAFLAVEPIKFRNRSFFESCYDVSLEIADKLLGCGYMFLSKFGKTCPVEYYEKYIPIQMYQVAKANNILFSVIHRSYIYYIIGDKRKALFKNDPLKYIDQKFNFPLISYKVAVTGPPKCGKTILSERIQKEFGFKLVSRGQAAKYVLKYLPYSDLACNMEFVLRKGWELTDEMTTKCVEAATFDSKVAAQGVIFDGFPSSVNEAKSLAYLDLVPNIIIDLEAAQAEVLECLSADVPKWNLPKFSPGFMTHVYEEWLKEVNYYRDWFDKEYQAMIKIPITTSNWSVWHQSKEYLLSTFSEINHYRRYIMEDWPLRLGNMLVTPLEFLERQSSFKSFCPLCLHFSNILETGGDPPDRTGLTQFGKHFYWLCKDHIDIFLNSPEMYLPPYNSHKIPESLPTKVIFETTPDNLQEDGACVVCYKTRRIIIKGKLIFSATYNEKAYLFDTVECLNTFMRQPQMFLFNIEFRAPIYPSLDYKELPVLGMLEQYVAKYVVEGVSFIAKRRPVIPGLSISTSALVGLGIFLKLKGTTPGQFKKYYEEGFKVYSERRLNLLQYLEVMKKYRNPYLYYEEPLPQFQLPPASAKTESLTTMMSRIVDKCVDDIYMYVQDAENSVDSLLDDF